VREQRADARRNHELLVLAAREVFAEQGSDAPMEAVARRAGVGNATMYRHFATRHDLLLAVYADDIAVLCAQAHRQADPFDWLWQVVEHLAGTRDIALAVLVGDYAGPLVTTARRLFGDRGAEALLLAAGIALAPAARRGRLFGVVRRGLSG
jgi:AcrR family transcriptional regulator